MNNLTIKSACESLLEQRPSGAQHRQDTKAAQTYNRWHLLCCDVADQTEKAADDLHVEFDRVEFFADCHGLSKAEFLALAGHEQYGHRTLKMTDRTKLKLMWGGFGAAIVLGILLPATQTTIFVLGGLMCLAFLCAPLMATNKNRKDNA